jgi:hypothetical protein
MQNSPSATQVVFNSYELLENILIFLSAPNVLLMIGVSRSVCDVVERSKAIHKCLLDDHYYYKLESFYEGTYPMESGPAKGDRFVWQDFDVAGNMFNTSEDSWTWPDPTDAMLVIRRHQGIQTAMYINTEPDENQKWTVKVLTSANSTIQVVKSNNLRIPPPDPSYNLSIIYKDLQTGHYRSRQVQDESMCEYLKKNTMSAGEQERDRLGIQYRRARWELDSTEVDIKQFCELLASEWLSTIEAEEIRGDLEYYLSLAARMREELANLDVVEDPGPEFVRTVPWC